MKKENKVIILGLLIIITVVFLLLNFIVDRFGITNYFINEVTIKDIQITDNKINIITSTYERYCAVSYNEDKENLIFKEMYDNTCLYDGEYKDFYIYFKDKNNMVSEPIYINDYVIDIKLDDIYYIALNDAIALNNIYEVVGNPEIKIDLDGISVRLENNHLMGISNGKTIVKFINNDKVIKEIAVIVTDTIVKAPLMFDNNKKFLGCQTYSEEEAKLLDEILEDRINHAGYGTRAGVVAAGRFLTLEFPYKISYFYENGRVHESGVNFVDGEGRYYHRGLFLSKDKYDSLSKSIAGPAMWGCRLTNYEDAEEWGFKKYALVPNGLDCSGFVTWAILNGGFDVGDIGAGESAYAQQLTDRGKYTRLTNDLIYSGKIKVGDLFNFTGHIALIIGIDDNYYYVAESLNTFRGLVMKRYSKNNVNRNFTHVVLMDDYYKTDGNITNMWY